MSAYSVTQRFITSFSSQSQVSGAADDGDYVFDTAANDSGTVVATLSNLHVQQYDLQANALVTQFPAHKDRINSIEVSTNNPSLVLTTSDDKSVCLWDLRMCASSSGGGANMAPQYRAMLQDEVSSASLGVNDILLAVACDKSVIFYDLRTGGSSSSTMNSTKAPVGEYADAHTDVVTQVKFHPENPTHLVSAAEDGLICLFNTSVGEEEEAIVSVLNTDCPVRKFGFFGAGLEGLYCLSTTEIPSFWHLSSAQRISQFPDVRGELGVDYLVDCLYCPSSDSLTLLAGNYAGQGLLAFVDPTSIRLSATLSMGGHRATIRCASRLAYGASGGVHTFLTGGEDSQLIVWSQGSTESSSTRSAHSKPKKASQSNQLRSAPY